MPGHPDPLHGVTLEKLLTDQKDGQLLRLGLAR